MSKRIHQVDSELLFLWFLYQAQRVFNLTEQKASLLCSRNKDNVTQGLLAVKKTFA